MQIGTAATRAGKALQLLVQLPSLLRLYGRLLRDRRVSILPKILLVGAIVYVVLPFDLIPDVLPLVGQLDDVTVLLLAAHWFIDWCPPEVVLEHTRAVGSRRWG